MRSDDDGRRDRKFLIGWKCQRKHLAILIQTAKAVDGENPCASRSSPNRARSITASHCNMMLANLSSCHHAPAPYVPPPLDLLPGVLQDYVHAAAESLNVDVAYPFLPLLSSLGAAIGNTRSIILKRGFIQSPVIWTGIVGTNWQSQITGAGSRLSPRCWNMSAN